MTVKITSHRTVGRPRWNCGTSLIKQDVSSLLANLIFRNRVNITVIKAIPLSINGILTLSYKTKRNRYNKITYYKSAGMCVTQAMDADALLPV